ncbi:hypothetical protein A3731_07145 [Roseovarius sp. HI0049]|nr:hypothetical protein A3731_07145 [Roseovarius sp. HI0049]
MAYLETAEAVEIQGHGEEDEGRAVAVVLLGVLLVLAAWAAAVVTWGLPGLYIPAVALVPVCMLTIVRITLG